MRDARTISRNRFCQRFGGIVLIVILLASSVGRGDQLTELKLIVGPLERDIPRWEVSHFMDKWLHRVGDWIRRTDTRDERLRATEAYFARNEEINQTLKTLEVSISKSPESSALHQSLQTKLADLNDMQSAAYPIVEEFLEAVITKVVHQSEVIDTLGPLRWPPVDFAFENQSFVLVRSPRNRIERQSDFLLKPGLSLSQQIRLELRVERLDNNTSAIVLPIGGVATYPAQIVPNRSLHRTLELVSHEWLHHWLAFRPLGQRWFAGGELQSINETVANIFGEEVGDRAYEMVTGEAIQRIPWTEPRESLVEAPESQGFDFQREMRATRLELEQLLHQGRIDYAEQFLENRRAEFVQNGFSIRKLNNAWFAFNGTYANSAASVSPIEAQLRAIRADSSDLRDFLDRIAGITQAGQLEEYGIEAGWRPTAKPIPR